MATACRLLDPPREVCSTLCADLLRFDTPQVLGVPLAARPPPCRAPVSCLLSADLLSRRRALLARSHPATISRSPYDKAPAGHGVGESPSPLLAPLLHAAQLGAVWSVASRHPAASMTSFWWRPVCSWSARASAPPPRTAATSQGTSSLRVHHRRRSIHSSSSCRRRMPSRRCSCGLSPDRVHTSFASPRSPGQGPRVTQRL